VSPARQQRPVAIDTNVFGAKLLPRTAALAAAYEPFLTGRPAFISFVTVAELRYGARRAGLGRGPPADPGRPHRGR
jgi:predicted nucleic acid-binding protein